jgi:hypothetical protein
MSLSISNSDGRHARSPGAAGTQDDLPSGRPSRGRSRLRRFLRLGWGALFAFVILGLLDAFLFRNPAFYDLGNKNGARGGFIGQFAHIARAFDLQGGANIEFAIFGDSQGIDALRPDIMAEALGVPASRIFNFSTSGGKPTDSLYLYRTYAERMPNLKRVIYVMNEHQLNNADAGEDTKFKFHATLRQRLVALDRDNYGELLVGWALRSFGLRTEWTNLLERYRAGTWPPEEDAVFPGGIEPTRWSEPKTRTPEYADEVADRWFRGWQPEGVYTEAFGELLAAWRERGLDVVVVQIPRMPAFDAAVAAKHARERDEYVRIVSEAAKAAGAAFEIVPAEEAGLDESHFRDVNHMNPDGAGIFSRHAADRWWKRDR